MPQPNLRTNLIILDNKYIDLLLVVILFMFLSSCHRQINNRSLENVYSAREIEAKNSIQQNDQENKRISEVVRTIFQDSRGDIWFGTQNGLFKLHNNVLVQIHAIQSEEGKGVTIKAIAEDKNGKLWFGHTDGISSVDGEKVNNYYESDGLLSNDVWCITTDTDGNIWIGTIEGVSVFNGQNFIPFELPEGKIDSTVGVSSNKIVHHIMEDSKGTLWFCSNAGLFSYSNDTLVNISTKLGIQTNFINEIVEYDKGNFWISTKECLYTLKENKLQNITKDKIEVGKGIGSLAKDKDGTIWFVSNQHYLYTYVGEECIEFQKSEDNKGPVIFQIYKDQLDRLWFVGYGGAYRLEDGKFIPITKQGPW